MSARAASSRASGGVVRVGEVQGDRALVAVDAQVVGGDPVAVWWLPGPGVVALGTLDLDHLGAQVGQQHGGVRPGEDAGEIGDQQPGQRPA